MASSSAKTSHGRRSPVLLTPVQVIQEFKSVGVLVAPVTCNPTNLKVFVRHPREDDSTESWKDRGCGQWGGGA